MLWNLDSDRPIYLQIVETIQRQIVSGAYQPGDKLPSVRELAGDAGVNPNTMQKAFAELERNSLVVTQRTAGRSVTEDTHLIAEIRDKLAKEQIRTFFRQMKELGYRTEEAAALLEHTYRELHRENA